MKYMRFFSVILALILALNLSVTAFAAKTEETESSELPAESSEQESLAEDAPEELEPFMFPVDYQVAAKGAALIELNSNTLLYGYQMDEKLYPASLTKIMTCMLALEHGDIHDILTVSPTALEGLSEYGSTAGLLEGEELPLDEILYCIMVSSANEGCNVVAEYVAGDVKSFVDMMNEKAKSLGMYSTHFANPHGLHNENHYTTVHDLSILARWAWKDDQFRVYSTATTHVVPRTNKSEARNLYSTNYLTSTYIDDKYYYSKASGIKTGFTTPAGGCLISTASDGNLDLMSIVCGCSPQTADNGEYGDERFVETRKLFEMGFESFSFVQVLSNTKMVAMPEVAHSDGRDNVVVRADDNRTILLPAGCSVEDISLTVEYDEPLPIEAPLEAGQRVGVVKAYYQNKMVASCPAVTVTAVQRSGAAPVKEETGEPEQKEKSWFLHYWYLTIPLIVVLLLLILLLVLRGINVHKAKKRAERRREREKRRQNHE